MVRHEKKHYMQYIARDQQWPSPTIATWPNRKRQLLEIVPANRLNQMTHLKSLHHLENHYQQPCWGGGDDDDDFLTPIAIPTNVNTNMKIFILKHYSPSTLVFSPDRPADCQHGCPHWWRWRKAPAWQTSIRNDSLSPLGMVLLSPSKYGGSVLGEEVGA